MGDFPTLRALRLSWVGRIARPGTGCDCIRHSRPGGGFAVTALLRVSVFLVIAAVGALGLVSGAAAARYAAVVVEVDSGRVLYSRNAHKRRYPASLAKMMTLYLTFEALEAGALSLMEPLTVSRRAAGQAPSRLGLKAGETITVEDAILALVAKSANDAATALAESIAGREISFAKQMTRKGRELGMRHSQFRNASGLPNRRQRSTAMDISILARALLTDFPQHYHYFSTPHFKFKNRTHKNHNKLLNSYPGLDGIKTGYIRASGFNLAASAERGGQRLVGVVLGGRTQVARDRQMRRILDIGFSRLRMFRALEEGQRERQAGAGGEASRPPAVPTPPRSPTVDARRDDSEAADHATAAAGDALWGVQVGAFQLFAAARRQLHNASRALPRLLHGKAVTIVGGEGDADGLYRARLTGLSEADARLACRRLVRKGMPCLPVVLSSPTGAP